MSFTPEQVKEIQKIVQSEINKLISAGLVAKPPTTNPTTKARTRY
jgi:hypothetical protein